MITKRRWLLVLAVCAFGACIPYPDQGDGGQGSSLPSIATGIFPGLDPGANEQQSLHFKVHAYGAQTAQEVSEMCERAYGNVMNDTGLYSFQPHGMYEITVYGSQDEYRKKTGQQDWSAGVTAGGNAVYVFYSPTMHGVLAHEITHVIWYEFMNGRLSDQTRWINEGLAVYEESKERNRGQELFADMLPTLRSAPIPMDQLENMAPSNENGYSVSLWYGESESMIRHMIERGGRIGFGQFLTAIQMNQGLDQAIATGYPGQWPNLAAFYSEWQRSIQ